MCDHLGIESDVDVATIPKSKGLSLIRPPDGSPPTAEREVKLESIVKSKTRLDPLTLSNLETMFLPFEIVTGGEPMSPVELDEHEDTFAWMNEYGTFLHVHYGETGEMLAFDARVLLYFDLPCQRLQKILRRSQMCSRRGVCLCLAIYKHLANILALGI